MQGLRAALAALLIAVLPVSALAQTAPSAAAAEVKPAAEMDYGAWEKMAAKAEADIADPNVATQRLEVLRAQLADWRAAFLGAQSANSSRIATLKSQIDALGPVPAEGAVEAEEIATRRQELSDQMVRLQAPRIAAEEAYQRADGLIREIDRLAREQQAQELLQAWPSPADPTNWPEAAIGLSDTLLRIWDEGREAATDPRAHARMIDNLPLVIFLVVAALGLMIYARRWSRIFADRLQGNASALRRRVLALIVSLGEVVAPIIATTLLIEALKQTEVLGEITGRLGEVLPGVALLVFGSAWLGARAFPRVATAEDMLVLPAESRAEGRLVAVALGLVASAQVLRDTAMEAQAYSDATTAVITFPILCVGGLFLWRMGRLLRLAQSGQGGDPAPGALQPTPSQSFAMTLLGLLGRVLAAIAVLAPTLAAFGYVRAAAAVVFPAILSLALLTALFVLQRLFADLWALVVRDESKSRDALVPVLAGFILALASLPLFAMTWGARASDITELWNRFTEGFQLGTTRISPSNFVIFVLVFVAGYLMTRLVQGALRSTILPKTRLDPGGQTAVLAGISYVGIFLAALLAINAAGIDLSGLAIVAGALSVGIGFGLQNIVSNFISGIILLIERPVSEGDWIEVGGVQGRVRAISVRSTRIETFDRNDVIVPNADLITGQVTNWTRFNLSGRLIVPVVVAMGSDTRKVEAILRRIAEAQPLAVLNPAPMIAVMGYTDRQISFELRVILRDVNFSLQVRTEINHQILQAFADEGIAIAPPAAPPPEPSAARMAETLLALAELTGGRGLHIGPNAAPPEAEPTDAETDTPLPPQKAKP